MPDERSRIDTLALEEVQNRLHASLVREAVSNAALRAGDWVQGGWSRASALAMPPDRIDYGFTSRALRDNHS